MADRTPPDRGPLWKRLVPVLVAVGIVVYLFGWVLPQLIDYRAVFRAIGTIDLVEWIVLVMAAALRVIPEGWVYAAAQPGLSARQGTSLFLVSNALSNVPPGGLDVVSRYQMTRSWGFSAGSATSATLLSWISVTVGRLLVPVVAVFVLGLRGVADGDLDAAAVVGLLVALVIGAVLVLVLRSPRLAIRAGDVLGRFVTWALGLFGRSATTDFGALLREFHTQSADVLQTRWRLSLATGLAAQAATYVVLFLSLRFVGLGSDDLHWSAALAAFALVAIVTTVPLLNIPGIAETVYIAVLTEAAGTGSSDRIAAAVFVFRLLTWLAPIVVGGLAFSRWREGMRRRADADGVDAVDDAGAAGDR